MWRYDQDLRRANRMKYRELDQLMQWVSSKNPCAFVTDLETGAQAFVDADTVSGELSLSDAQVSGVREMVDADESRMLQDNNFFVRVHNPPPRLIIVGAVHIAQALAPIAQVSGFDVTIIDPREAFLSASQLKPENTFCGWPDEGIKAVKPDNRTAVVTLTHDPKLDDSALSAALDSAAFYIGSLGSRKTHAKRIQRLKSEGISDDELARIHGPVGLDIGAKTPAEIAISIMAEVIECHRNIAS